MRIEFAWPKDTPSPAVDDLISRYHADETVDVSVGGRSIPHRVMGWQHNPLGATTAFTLVEVQAPEREGQ